jgi:hypothetical protein
MFYLPTAPVLAPLVTVFARQFATVSTPKGDLLVFGLPGNPVSSLVTFHLVVVPCIRYA